MSEHPTACTSRVATGERGRGTGEDSVGPAKPHPDIPQLFRGIFYPSSSKRKYPTVFRIRNLWGHEPLRKG